MKRFVLTPFKAVCLGALLGLGFVAVIALTPGLNKYTGNFFGDGGGLSNVPTSGMGTVITNGVFQWQLDATFENTLKKEGVHGVLFTYDHIDGSGATALWRTTDAALHFPNPPVFDGFNNVLFSGGPSGGLTAVANGTGYLHDDGLGDFVWQTIPWTDIQQGGATNGQFMTWSGTAWVPTTDPGSNTTINTYNITYKVAHGGTLILTNDLQLLTTNAQANTLLQTDGSTNVESLANGTGYLHDNGSGTFVYQSIPASDLPNVIGSVEIPMGAFFTNNVGDGATLTAASALSITNAGDGWVFSSGSNTNCIRTRFALPWDWNGGTVKVGTWWVCTGTNNTTATNVVENVRAAAVGAGDDLSNLTFGNVRLTNNVNIAAYKQGTEGITGTLTIGNTPGVTKSIIWEVQRQAKDGGDTETNSNLMLVGFKVYYTRAFTSTLPTSSP